MFSAPLGDQCKYEWKRADWNITRQECDQVWSRGRCSPGTMMITSAVSVLIRCLQQMLDCGGVVWRVMCMVTLGELSEYQK